jgi:hypothetical protein
MADRILKDFGRPFKVQWTSDRHKTSIGLPVSFNCYWISVRYPFDFGLPSDFK